MAKVGRPKGTKKEPTKSFHRRLNPIIAEIFDKVISEIKIHLKNENLDYEVFYGNKEITIKVFTNKII